MNATDLIELFSQRRPGPWVKWMLEHNLDNMTHDEMHQMLEAEFPTPVTVPLQALGDVTITNYLDMSATEPYVADNNAAVVETVQRLCTTPYIRSATIHGDGCNTGDWSSPVGVVWESEKIHPALVSADFCCSLYGSNLGKVSIDDARDFLKDFVHFSEGPRKGKSISDKQLEKFEAPRHLSEAFRDNKFLHNSWKKRDVDNCLCSSGASNHFVTLSVSETTGDVWIVSHWGSRRVGSNLYKEGMKVAQAHCAKVCPDLNKEMSWIPEEDEDEFYDAMLLVKEWTRLNHSLQHDALAAHLGVNVTEQYFTPHNFGLRDVDEDGKKIYKIFKGSTPMSFSLNSDPIKIIPMNMRDPILLCSQGSTEFANHGLGRWQSRTGWLKSKGLHNIKKPSVYKEMKVNRKLQAIIDEELEGSNLEYISFTGNPDISELPSSYKSSETVISEMLEYDIVKIKDKLIPKVTIMAGIMLRTPRK